MSDILRGGVYSGHPEFDNLQCRHVSTTQRVGITNDGFVVRQTFVTFDFGKPERVAADPDAELTRDEGVTLYATVTGAAQAGRRAASQARHAALEVAVTEYLGDRGLSAIAEMADALGVGRALLADHMPARVGAGRPYVRRRAGYATLWGLAGVDYGEYAGLPADIRMLVEVVRETPRTTAEVCAATEMSKSTVNAALRRYPDVFRVVGTRENRQRQVMAVWGLVVTNAPIENT